MSQTNQFEEHGLFIETKSEGKIFSRGEDGRVIWGKWNMSLGFCDICPSNFDAVLTFGCIEELPLCNLSYIGI